MVIMLPNWADAIWAVDNQVVATTGEQHSRRLLVIIMVDMSTRELAEHVVRHILAKEDTTFLVLPMPYLQDYKSMLG